LIFLHYIFLRGFHDNTQSKTPSTEPKQEKYRQTHMETSERTAQ